MADQQIQIPQVLKTEAVNFSKVWKNPAGLTIILDDSSLQFATDFANIVLRSFVMQQVQIANMKMQAMQAQVAGQKADIQNAPTDAVAKAVVPPPPATTKGLIQLTD